MSAIATMKAVVDAEKKWSTREAGQRFATAPAAALHPLLNEQSRRSGHPLSSCQDMSKQPATPLTSTLDSPLTSAAMVVPSHLNTAPVVPKLNTTASSANYYSDSANSSASSSPTQGSHDAVTFTFSSPLFYDQKLYIYHNLLAVYQQLAKCIDEHPVILLMLQYTVALIHGFTVYLISVILSIAQFVMIAFTIENLDWIQSYKPLMCEWDSHFPGFVFPALDIDSEEDDDDLYASKTVSCVHKGGRYWQAQATLKAGDDLADDGYHSEESQQQLNVRQSMNSTLRKRLAKYQNWVPLLWSPEENSIQEASEETEEEEQGPDETADHYSARIRRALVRTLSGGNYKPTKGKRRVTFNEQVMIFGRRRSSQVSQEFSAGDESISITTPDVSSNAVKPSMMSTSQAEQASSTSMVAREQHSSSAGPVIVSDASTFPMDREKLATLALEEAEYQQRRALEDINGSGTSSPTFTATSPSESASILSSASSCTSSCSAIAKSATARIIKQSGDLRRSSSVPMKIGSFLSRHQTSNQEPRNTSPRHSSTFSESSTVSQNPRVLPNHLEPQQGGKQEAGSSTSTRSPISLGTRTKRSFSLALPRPSTTNISHSSTSAPTTSIEPNNKDPSALDRQGSVNKKNKNFMYRIVHPQRYRRELEQELTDRERQRLLAMAHLQRDHILAADSLDTGARFSSTEEAAALRASDSVLCGDSYYYATSAEYIEGLGAPNSVISTSFGTSFPEKLQHHNKSSSGSKGRAKLVRPASYNFDCRPVEVHTGACGYGSEGEMTSSRMTGKLEKPMSSGPHHGFFRWESKKKNEGVLKDRTQSPNRLQQLFSHPGHKKSHSSSSSLDAVLTAPPKDTGSAMNAVFAQGGRSSPPVFSSPTAANAHKLLSRARSNSRAFTTFTALGMPANPPAQSMKAAQRSESLAVHEMEHTSFAAFGFPSPTSSPVQSAPASPRHSTSSIVEFHGHLARQQPMAVLGYQEFIAQGVTESSSEEYYFYHQQQVQNQLVQDQYCHQQQEVLLPEDDGVQGRDGIYYLPSSAPIIMESVPFTGKGAGQDDDGHSSRSSSRSSNHGQGDLEGATAVAGGGEMMVEGAVVTKRSRGLSFMRKLSLKKK